VRRFNVKVWRFGQHFARSQFGRTEQIFDAFRVEIQEIIS
jgi:hypothetical protein